MSSTLPQTRVRVQRIAEAAVERARLTVVPRQRVRAPRVPFVTLVSLVLLAGVVGLLMFNTTMQQNAFTATALEERAAELRSQEQTLEADLAALQDPQHIGGRAQAMGMVLPTCPRFLFTATDTVSASCPTPPEPLDVRPPKAPRPRSLVPEVQEIEAEPAEPARNTRTNGRAAEQSRASNERHPTGGQR